MKAFEFEPLFNKSILDNGVRILTEHHPSSRAVCAGIFVDQGTRDEPEDIIGAAHFVEHMVFKGTETRDAYEIARSLEAVGGELNAYTTREQTCFHATSLREHLTLSLDVLSDLMSNAQFETNDFKKERDVIIQEIHMSQDEYDDYIFDLVFENAYKGHELGRSILGTPKTLEQITRRKLMDFYTRRYQGHNMLVCVAGHVNHEEVVQLMSRTLNLRRRTVLAPPRKRPAYRTFQKVLSRSSEQLHVLVALPSVSVKDKQRFESYLANAALGGGMTSRLYQKVREKLGIAYTVYSYLQPFYDTGIQTIYSATSPRHMKRILSVIFREIESLARRGLTRAELDYYRTQVIGGLVLESDDIDNRMNAIGYSEMIFGENRTVDQTIQELQKVTVESMNAYLKKHFDIQRASAILIGDINEDRASNYLTRSLGGD